MEFVMRKENGKWNVETVGMMERRIKEAKKSFNVTKMMSRIGDLLVKDSITKSEEKVLEGFLKDLRMNDYDPFWIEKIVSDLERQIVY